jgi:hypothetical protein
MERLAGQRLVGVRSVDVGGVDERDAGLDYVPQRGDPAVVVGVLAPDLVAGRAHGPESDPG